MKLIALVKDPNRFSPVLSFLKRREIDCETAPGLQEVAEAITKDAVQVVLISIDFPDARVEKFIGTIEHNPSILVLVFAENQVDVGARLKKLRARNIFYDYPTGVKIMMRISQFQKGVEPSSDTRIFKGKRSMFNSTDQSQRMTHVTSGAASGMISGAASSGSVLQRRPQPAVRSVESRKPDALSPQERREKIEWAIEESLQFVCPTDPKPVAKIDSITECEIFCLDTAAFKGTFITAYCRRRRNEGSPLQAIQEQVVKNLVKSGIPVVLRDVRILPMLDFELPTYLIASAEFSMVQRCKQFDVTLAYFSSVSIIPTFVPEAGPLQGIEIRHFIPNSKLNVDVYISLSGSGRPIKYWHKDDKVDPVQLDRIISKNVRHLRVLTDDMKKFKRYCTHQAILSEVEKLDRARLQKTGS